MKVLPLLLVASACMGQTSPSQPVSQELLRLARLRHAASRLFDKLPNITCTLSIERSYRLNTTRKFQLIDNLRLEVALIDGKELYAWPGSKRFEDRDLVELVGTDGAIGDGDFAVHAKSILFSGRTTLKFVGDETRDGRLVGKWQYRYPIETSQYMVRIRPLEGMVGYSGFLYEDAANHDLLRIEMDIDEIPGHLPLRSGRKIITYERVRIGETSLLLPSESEMTLIHAKGTESLNRTVFSSCRQFTGESTLTFDEPAPGAPAPGPTVAWSLPGGLAVQLKTKSDLNLVTSAVGDQISFAVAKDASSGKQVWLPSGAQVEGRIASLDCPKAPVQHCFALIRLESFSFANKEGAIRASMESPSMDQQFILMATARRAILSQTQRIFLAPPEGSGSVFVKGAKWPKSSVSVWRTVKEPGGK